MVHKNALVTGANGYIGLAVCRAFVRAGWRVFGTVRREESASVLERDEVVPILAPSDDLGYLNDLFKYTTTFDAIIGCTETSNYEAHFKTALAMVRRVSETSNQHGVRPLVLWSSGCKDYGMTGLDGEADLAPHVETSPLKPMEQLAARTYCSLKMLEQTDLFDAAVLRPTNVYGYSSSYYGVMFEFAAKAAASGAQSLDLVDVHPKSVLHAMHVDDCAEAYLALVEHPDRDAVAGQCFNISAHKYETTDTILQALAREYNFPAGAKFISTAENPEAVPTEFFVRVIFGFTQWVGSEKIRTLTGWTDKRMLWTENLSAYRRAFEAAVNSAHEDIARVKARQEAWRNSQG